MADFCGRCGTGVLPQQKFCPKCGTSTTAVTPPAARPNRTAKVMLILIALVVAGVREGRMSKW